MNKLPIFSDLNIGQRFTPYAELFGTYIKTGHTEYQPPLGQKQVRYTASPDMPIIYISTVKTHPSYS